MRLRGHHLACLLGFTGHGYDPAFTARLADLAARYRDGEPVEVVAGLDDVCARCPGRDGDTCARHPGAEAAIRAQDAAVLSALGLGPGDRTTCARVTAALAVPATRRAVRDACGDCRWTAVCAWWRGDA
ncbi:MAG TPA: DUF1284 domain-containing protein [Myxococcota bacterium]|nr:DUF1284 domain-containing protein [Myxococcota bacterium]